MDSMKPALIDYVFDHAERIPDLKAISGEHDHFTYGELLPRVRALAERLRAMGVGRGDFVGAITTPRTDAYTLFLASNAIGAIWLGLNHKYTLRELDYMIGDARPKVLFFVSEAEGRDYLPDVRELAARYDCLDEFICFDRTLRDDALGEITSFEALIACGDSASDAVDIARDGEDVAAIVYTSGSTGNPKGALLRNKSIVHRALVQNEDYRLKAGRPHCYQLLPLNHVGGLILISAFAMVNGGTLTFREKFDPGLIGRDVRENDINFLAMLPTMYQLVLSSPDFDEADYANCQVFWWGGANMPKAMIAKLRTMGHGEVRTNFGMTEVCSSITRTDPDLDIDILVQTIGYPLDGEMRIVRPDGEVAGIGETGEGQVHRKWVMKGYLNRPDATKEAFTEDGEWFKTGDLLELMEDGKNMKYVGRISDMFKSGGYNVYPREIENWIEKHPAVDLVAVFGTKDDLFGEVGHAAILVKKGHSLTANEMKAHCKEGLANYKVPKTFDFRDELPLLGIGKVNRKQLKAEIDD